VIGLEYNKALEKTKRKRVLCWYVCVVRRADGIWPNRILN
jgi:hypothetical protein